MVRKVRPSDVPRRLLDAQLSLRNSSGSLAIFAAIRRASPACTQGTALQTAKPFAVALDPLGELRRRPCTCSSLVR